MFSNSPGGSTGTADKPSSADFGASAVCRHSQTSCSPMNSGPGGLGLRRSFSLHSFLHLFREACAGNEPCGPFLETGTGFHGLTRGPAGSHQSFGSVWVGGMKTAEKRHSPGSGERDCSQVRSGTAPLPPPFSSCCHSPPLFHHLHLIF